MGQNGIETESRDGRVVFDRLRYQSDPSKATCCRRLMNAPLVRR